MDMNILSPYVRLAIHSTITAPFVINSRILYDYEIIYVKDGKCKLTVDGTEYDLRKNNVVFLRPGILHSFRSYNEDFSQPHIHFDAIYSEKSTITPISYKTREAMDESETKLIQQDIFSSVDIPYVFVPSNPVAFQNLFFEVINLYGAAETNTLKLKAKMLELLSLLISEFGQNRQYDVKITDRYIENIKSYIDENYRNILTLDMLSGMFFVNKFTLMRKFKALYGINVIKYHNKKRIDAAKNMLRNTNMTVKEIGDFLNFTDAYSFSRFFKSYTGISPMGFKKIKY